jgi:hypothetical protein
VLGKINGIIRFRAATCPQLIFSGMTSVASPAHHLEKSRMHLMKSRAGTEALAVYTHEDQLVFDSLSKGSILGMVTVLYTGIIMMQYFLTY